MCALHMNDQTSNISDSVTTMAAATVKFKYNKTVEHFVFTLHLFELLCVYTLKQWIDLEVTTSKQPSTTIFSNDTT